MNRKLRLVVPVAMATCWSMMALAGAPIDPVDPSRQSPSSIDPTKKPLSPKSCPDPAVDSVTITNITRRSAGVYDFTVSAVVRNVGYADYSSGAQQQSVQIYRKPQGASSSLVHTQAFQNLRRGATVTARYRVTNWGTSTEFPPDFLVLIAYDPDIALDGNVANDDCQSGNNRRSITGAQINRQIQASGR